MTWDGVTAHGIDEDGLAEAERNARDVVEDDRGSATKSRWRSMVSMV